MRLGTRKQDAIGYEQQTNRNRKCIRITKSFFKRINQPTRVYRGKTYGFINKKWKILQEQD